MLVEKNGTVNLYWAATFIAADFVATRIFRHDSTIMIRPVMMRHYKHIWIQTSASALGSFSFFKSFGRGQTETIRGQVVFLIFLSIFLHFSLLTWLNSHSSRKPIKREVCIHANISPGSFFMSRLWRRSMKLNNAINFIQNLENTGKKRIKFLIHKSWRTEKVIGKKYQSGRTDSSAFLSCHVRGSKLSRKPSDQCTQLMWFLFYFVFEGNFQVQAPPWGGLISGGAI